MSDKIKIGISIGDFNGVGPEIILKTFRNSPLVEKYTFAVYGSSSVLQFYDKQLFEEPSKYFKTNYIENVKPGILNVLNLNETSYNIVPGELSNEAGKLAFLALEAATKDLIDKKIDILVTAPLNKSTIKHDDKFVGQTEYIEKLANASNSLMFMCSENLRVALVTNHLPLKEVPSKITSSAILDKIKILDQCLKRDFLIDRPRIAVLGLNPHAGDYGLLGQEESDIIAPSVNKAKELGISVFGPYSADGLFGSGQFKHFDALLAMYHDQGLVPFKAITFSSGVNMTAGLNVVRTSPDHGTAYDIAPKFEADTESFLKAIYMGIDVHKNRLSYDEMIANPVKRNKLSSER